jgi:hypothetical protein
MKKSATDRPSKQCFHSLIPPSQKNRIAIRASKKAMPEEGNSGAGELV